jgi:hypothetical protein
MAKSQHTQRYRRLAAALRRARDRHTGLRRQHAPGAPGG